MVRIRALLAIACLSLIPACRGGGHGANFLTNPSNPSIAGSWLGTLESGLGQLGIVLDLQQVDDLWRGGHSIFTLGRTEYPRTGFLSFKITDEAVAGTMTLENAPFGLFPYGTRCQGQMVVNGTIAGTRSMRLVSDGITTCGNMTDVVITLRR